MLLVPAFRNTSVRPMQLRAILREAREHGEAVVAWGSVETTPDPAMSTLAIAAGMIPIVGLAAGGALFRAKRFVLILTDERLLVMTADGRRGRLRRARADAPVWGLRVRRLEKGCFAIRGPEDAREVRVRAARVRGRANERFHAALEHLARAEHGAR